MELCPKLSIPGLTMHRRMRSLLLQLSGGGNVVEMPVYCEQNVNLRAEQLLQQYETNMYRLAYSYLHNQEDAQDIVQDTIIRYLERKPVFKDQAHAKAWLLRVAANLSKNLIKYNGYRQADKLMEELAAEGQEDLRFVWEAVSQLPVNSRTAIHLFYQEGYSTDEIARILRRNPATVRSDLKRGRDQLKVILKEAYDFG